MSEVSADGISDSIRDEIVSLIRDDSKKGLISSEEKLRSCTSDCGDLSGFSGKISENPEFTDIKDIRGSAVLYYYSTAFMSGSYARLAVMLEEGELLKIVVSTIRNDCRIYPRTTSLAIFTEAPFCISGDELDDLLKIIESDKQYSDIGFCKTSTDSIYLFSTEYMQRAQAEYLSEWDAVGQYESQ